ncbi:MAG: hypothetical protein NVSMB26_01260 [Beijerinckiaceae bacterium]
MLDLKATAHQTRTGIYVHVAALLADTCMRAKISGTYPGTIIHIVDPGHGEVFIEEFRDPGSHFCADHLVPWEAHAMLPGDFGHKEVVIFVNGKMTFTVKVEGRPERVPSEKDWIVTALVGPDKPPFFNCAVRHKNDIFPAIYRRVFGPAIKAECDAFMGKECIKFVPPQRGAAAS